MAASQQIPSCTKNPDRGAANATARNVPTSPRVNGGTPCFVLSEQAPPLFSSGSPKPSRGERCALARQVVVFPRAHRKRGVDAVDRARKKPRPTASAHDSSRAGFKFGDSRRPAFPHVRLPLAPDDVEGTHQTYLARPGLSRKEFRWPAPLCCCNPSLPNSSTPLKPPPAAWAARPAGCARRSFSAASSAAFPWGEPTPSPAAT